MKHWECPECVRKKQKPPPPPPQVKSPSPKKAQTPKTGKKKSAAASPVAAAAKKKKTSKVAARKTVVNAGRIKAGLKKRREKNARVAESVVKKENEQPNVVAETPGTEVVAAAPAPVAPKRERGGSRSTQGSSQSQTSSSFSVVVSLRPDGAMEHSITLYC
jgi:hypothetical protein